MGRRTLVLTALLAIVAVAGAPAPDAHAAGRFVTPPAYSAQGLASVVFEGGTSPELAAAAAEAGADGVWAQDAAGGFALLVVGGPAFVREAFDARFPGGFATVVAVTLARRSLAGTETLGPGRVNANEAPGRPVYVALGDSLAANAGVLEPRDGYVSRLHRALEARDARTYGLQNFGGGGETSASLLRDQLETAAAFMQAHEVAYVTLDIGANDLIVLLTTSDCLRDPGGAPCRTRIDASLAAYEANLERIFTRVREVEPGAQVLFLQMYNPFSFGVTGSLVEAETDRVTTDLNARGAAVARRHGALVGDGYTPFRGRAGALTHMSEPSPDIHPNAAGHEILARALLEAR